ncbi:replication factor c subunit 3 [Pyrenophora seminiperda CCB06]|uniref:Replication factor c subunit 3 n=1 Tax=Pyrenophora seminiperda CCB06 TaxID=1302712 RepID=A0A3M7MFC0_9PLEO|nr:replication factor c subunit 3 [Pyrenophora seminiperda CCB06]
MPMRTNVEKKEDSTAKRRPSVRRNSDPVPLSRTHDSTNLSNRQGAGRIAKRPTRWRGPKNVAAFVQSSTARMFKVQSTNSQQAVEPKQVIPQAETHDVQLRFSFSTDSDEDSEQEDSDNTFTEGLSQLSMENQGNSSASSSFEKASPVQRQLTTAQPPQSEPKPKREGYGFSYSDSFMFDSDDYPDTECEWEPEKPEGSRGSAPYNPYLNRDGTISGTSFENGSFDELVVLRDVGSFHLDRPQRRLSCTRATREDTVRLKRQAKMLMAKFDESSDVQAQLLARVERMVHAERQKTGDTPGPNLMTHCALKLRDYLLKSKADRIETGEHRTHVEHEIEWIKWLVEASRTGVMHVRTEGCTCRPEWEGL